MIGSIGRLQAIVIGSAASMAGVAITTDHVAIIGAVGTCIAGVVGALAWLDKRIGSQISAHQIVNHEAHESIRAEIAHLRELLAVTGAVPNLTPEPIRLERDP